MNLLSPNEIKALLNRYEARPSKGLGQNFLIDKNVLDKIIDAADIKPNDFVLEVGPGIGTLTQELAKKSKKIIAIEKDKTMVKILSETLKDFKNVEIIHGDILRVIPDLIRNPETPQSTSTLDSRFRGNDNLGNYKVIANIPYYITSPLIRKFLEAEKKPDFMILMLQKEVAERICSNPPDMSLLAVSVQFYAEAKIISKVSKNCFWPAPKIDSAIIKMTPHSASFPRKRESREFIDLFFKVVKAGFTQPRKQLAGNLSKTLNLGKKEVEARLQKNNIKPTQRAETLSIDDWQNLTSAFFSQPSD